MARMTIVISEDTNRSLRAYLGSQGGKKGDISRFIEDAVRWRLFDLKVAQVKQRNTNHDPEEVMEIIEEARRSV